LKNLKKFLFIINPISGGVDKDEMIAQIEAFCDAHGIERKLYMTTGKDDREIIRKEIAEFDPGLVVAAGGDGTVNLAAELILNTGKILGILPTGSGNGLAKDLKIPQLNVNAALETLLDPNIRRIDTLSANGKFFMHICDLGFNAHVVKLFNKTRNRGLLSYIRFSIREFFKYKTFRYQIVTDRTMKKGIAFMITIANSNQFGSNLTINPDGEMDDGEFEIIIIKRFPRKQIFSILFRLMTRKINFSPYTIVLKARQAVIVTKKSKTLQYDGEILGKIREVEIKIKPQSLQVAVPKEP